MTMFTLNRKFVENQEPLNDYMVKQAEFSKKYLEDKKGFEEWKAEAEAEARANQDHYERMAAMSDGSFADEIGKEAPVERRHVNEEQAPQSTDVKSVAAEQVPTSTYAQQGKTQESVSVAAPEPTEAKSVDAEQAKAETPARKWVRKNFENKDLLGDAKIEQKLIRDNEVEAIAGELDDKTIRNGLENAGNTEVFVSQQEKYAIEAREKYEQANERYESALKQLETLRAEYRHLEEGLHESKKESLKAAELVDKLEPHAEKAAREIGNYYRNERNGKMPAIEGRSSDPSSYALQKEDVFMRRMDTLDKAIESARDPMIRDRLTAQKEMEQHTYDSDRAQKIASMSTGITKMGMQDKAGIANDAANMAATRCALLDKQLEQRGMVVDCSQLGRPETREITKHETLEARGMARQTEIAHHYIEAITKEESARDKVTETKNKMVDAVQQGNRAVETLADARVNLDVRKMEVEHAEHAVQLGAKEEARMARIESQNKGKEIEMKPETAGEKIGRYREEAAERNKGLPPLSAADRSVIADLRANEQRITKRQEREKSQEHTR